MKLARVLPVVRALAAEGARVSIDTTQAEVAEAALADPQLAQRAEPILLRMIALLPGTGREGWTVQPAEWQDMATQPNIGDAGADPGAAA